LVINIWKEFGKAQSYCNSKVILNKKVAGFSNKGDQNS